MIHNKLESKSPATLLPPINQNETNLNKVLVITKNDLERISGHLNRRRNEEEANLDEIKRRKELHEKSIALTQNWNNTIQGSRRHKLAQKKVREDKLEQERQAVDLEHEKLMAEERKKALEKAKLLQYHDTDKVKSFHSALKLSEVLKEREAQTEMKKIIEEMRKEQDEETKLHLELLQREKDKQEAEKYIIKQKELDKVIEFNRQKVNSNTEKLKAQKEEVVKEGEILEKLNAQYNIEREHLEEIRLKKIKELKEAYDKNVEIKRKNAIAQEFLEEEENEEIRTYAAAKKKMAVMKREKEIELRNEKNENQEKMGAYLGSLMKEQITDEEFRIAKAAAKREAKLFQEELFKNLKQQKDIEGMNHFRKETIKRKELEKQIREREDEEFIKRQMEADTMYHAYEIEKNKKRIEQMALVTKKNRKLMKERKDLEKNEKYADREYVAKEMELLNLEDKQFEDYATKVIDYMGKHGRNTYPMKKVVYDQIYKGTNTFESETEGLKIKKHQNDVSTNKNLGFFG